MNMRTWQKNISLVLGLSLSATGAWASEFAISSDFMSAQLAEARQGSGMSASDLAALPPQSIDSLVAKLSGKKGRSKGSAPKAQPELAVPAAIMVQSPKTKGALVKVEVPAKPHLESEEEIFAEARRFLDIDLPPPTDHLTQKDRSDKIGSQAGIFASDGLSVKPSLQLLLRGRGDQLEIEPKAAHLQLRGEPLHVSYEGLSEQPQIFLRDSKRLRWDDKTKELYGQAIGQSEVFITYRNQLYILPIEVKEKVQPDLLGDDAKSLQQLTGILPLRETTLTYRGGQDFSRGSDARGLEDENLSLKASETEVVTTKQIADQKQQRFVYPSPSPQYKTIGVQVIDERSLPEQSLIYPVSGVKVRLLGTPVAAETDAKGHAMFGEVPAGSRFWVLVEDEKGLILPTVSELALPRSGKIEVLRVKSMSHRTFSAYMNIADTAQDARLGSVCGRAMQADGRNPQEGIRVSINRDADGPFYIGAYGPQKDLDATDKSGRFCFFNVQPGLAEISFFKGQNYQTAVALPVFAGAHSDEDIYLENSQGRRLFLAALPNATEQVYEDQASVDLFRPVDSVDLVAVGENEAMVRLSTGVVGHESGYTNFKGRIYALSQAPEFENVLYGLDRDKEWTRHMPVVPLLQRGFVEDLYHELNQQDDHSGIAFDPALGHALVYHALEPGQTGVKVSLINSVGQTLEDAWYFGNPALGTAKAVFFNLAAGVYQVKVESMQGNLLALDTLAVDFWTTAFVQTGSSAQYSLGYRRDEEE